MVDDLSAKINYAKICKAHGLLDARLRELICIVVNTVQREPDQSEISRTLCDYEVSIDNSQRLFISIRV